MKLNKMNRDEMNNKLITKYRIKNRLPTTFSVNLNKLTLSGNNNVGMNNIKRK